MLKFLAPALAVGIFCSASVFATQDPDLTRKPVADVLCEIQTAITREIRQSAEVIRYVTAERIVRELRTEQKWEEFRKQITVQSILLDRQDSTEVQIRDLLYWATLNPLAQFTRQGLNTVFDVLRELCILHSTRAINLQLYAYVRLINQFLKNDQKVSKLAVAKLLAEIEIFWDSLLNQARRPEAPSELQALYLQIMGFVPFREYQEFHLRMLNRIYAALGAEGLSFAVVAAIPYSDARLAHESANQVRLEILDILAEAAKRDLTAKRALSNLSQNMSLETNVRDRAKELYSSTPFDFQVVRNAKAYEEKKKSAQILECLRARRELQLRGGYIDAQEITAGMKVSLADIQLALTSQANTEKFEAVDVIGKKQVLIKRPRL